MISEVTRTTAWEKFKRADANARYYYEMAETYRKRHITNMSLLIATAGLAVILLGFEPFFLKEVTIALNVAIIIISIIGISIDFSAKHTTLKLVEVQSANLREKYQALWLDIENELFEESEIINRLKQLICDGNQIADAVTYAGIKFEPEINAETTELADQQLTRLYTLEEI